MTVGAGTYARTPRVSVGLGVRNGETFLEEAIDSILGQSLQDLELIVSDNASTDRSLEICRAFAARDSRVRVLERNEDVGAAENFSQLVRMARAPYFKWAAHDDRVEPKFLEKATRVLDDDATAVLCFSRIRIIDASGNVKRQGFSETSPRAASQEPWERFGEMIFPRHGCFPIWGLMRRAVLERTPLFADFISSDRALLGRLSLEGRLIELPEDLFLLRDHPNRSSLRYSFYRRGLWYNPRTARRWTLPNWRLGLEYGRAVSRAPISPWARFRCTLKVARWPLVECNWLRMMVDLFVVAVPSGPEWHVRLKKLYQRRKRKPGATRTAPQD